MIAAQQSLSAFLPHPAPGIPVVICAGGTLSRREHGDRELWLPTALKDA